MGANCMKGLGFLEVVNKKGENKWATS